MRTNYPRHLPAFSYVGLHRYFLTFCTNERQKLFTRPDAVTLVITQILRAAKEEGIAVIAYCAMPDHLHVVVEGERDDSDLKRFISRAKQYSGYFYSQTYGKKLWQRYGYEHVLRDSESTRSVVFYVLENPLRARLVQSIWDYPFMGSGLYSRQALIDYACYGRGEICHSEW